MGAPVKNAFGSPAGRRSGAARRDVRRPPCGGAVSRRGAGARAGRGRASAASSAPCVAGRSGARGRRPAPAVPRSGRRRRRARGSELESSASAACSGSAPSTTTRRVAGGVVVALRRSPRHGRGRTRRPRASRRRRGAPARGGSRRAPAACSPRGRCTCDGPATAMTPAASACSGRRPASSQTRARRRAKESGRGMREIGRSIRSYAPRAPPDARGVRGRLRRAQSTCTTRAGAAVDAHGASAGRPRRSRCRGQQVGAVEQAERRPVAEGDRHAGGAAARGVEPRRGSPAARRRRRPWSAKSSVPSAVTKRIRVSALTMKRSRSAPAQRRRSSAPARCRTSRRRNSRGGALAQRALAPRRRAASVVRQVPLRHDAGVQHQPAVRMHRHAAAGAASRARPRGRARRGCRRACRCGAAAARRRRRRAGAGRGCRAGSAPASPRPRSRRSTPSESGPRLTRSPST